MKSKATAWKKNRKLGDVYGGRRRRKIPDNIFRRCHSLARPDSGVDLPILIQDNPSRQFFFPLSAEEALEALQALPKPDYDGVAPI